MLAYGRRFKRGRVSMALDPEEFVTLTNHGTMKLRAAVARTMMLLPKERKRATIVREGKPAILKFDDIKDLAERWKEQEQLVSLE